MSSEGRFRQRLNTLAANWRVLALRGLAALIFGLVILFWPGLILAVLSLLFGVYALVDGGIVVVPALRTSDRGARRWPPLAEGTVGVVAGLVALLWPAMTPRALFYIIVVWAVATGTLKIINAIALRVAACRQRRTVGALGRDPCGHSELRSAGLGAFHRDFRHSGGRGADRLPDAGPTTAWAGLTLRNPELLAPTVPATLENRADSAFRVMERNTTITLRILFPVSKRLFG